MINVILCGGNGTRLWPLSRTSYPKQFSKDIYKQSLFQKTAARNRDLCNEFLVVSSTEHYFLAKDQLEEVEIMNGNFILEPAGRNTAPAVALACLAIKKEDLVFITPSDQIIISETNYRLAVEHARFLAEDGHMVMFGIKPTSPETGYGYIEANGENVISFKEKPDVDKATEYLERGNYLWNSGMFLFKAGAFLEELREHCPDIYESSLTAYNNAKENPIRIDSEDMLSIPTNSIDYAVMEKSSNLKVVKMDIEWSDLGSFDSIYEKVPKTAEGNTLNNNNIYLNSHNNLILANDRMVATIDIDDLIVIDTDDALLISKKGSSQKVKQVVEQLQVTKPGLTTNHRTTYRPWGSYTVLEQSIDHKINKVLVKPGMSLTRQKHNNRNEHWIVLNGTAKIELENKEIYLEKNQSTYIRIGEEHRLENPGDNELVIIEVQVGQLVLHDDIVVVN